MDIIYGLKLVPKQSKIKMELQLILLHPPELLMKEKNLKKV